MKIVFMGSAEFGLPTLKALLERYDVAAVVSAPARYKGRGLKLFDSPITEFAEECGIEPILTPENLLDPIFINQLKSLNVDMFVVVAFRILHADVYSIPRLGALNIHASLLPLYRGAAPIQRAIEAGEKETGITVFKIDDGIDTGGIICQRKITIGDKETTPELYERLSLLGAEVLLKAIDDIACGNVSAAVQNSLCSTRAPKLSRQEGHINWNLSATAIFNKIRAFKPFPGTYFFINEKRINIEWGIPMAQTGEEVSTAAPETLSSNTKINSMPPGAILYSRGDHIDIQCGDGILRISKVKPEGRSAMDVSAFLLGHSIADGIVLE